MNGALVSDLTATLSDVTDFQSEISTDERPTLETLDLAFYIGSTPSFLYLISSGSDAVFQFPRTKTYVEVEYGSL